jgi:hypothetical protein
LFAFISFRTHHTPGNKISSHPSHSPPSAQIAALVERATHLVEKTALEARRHVLGEEHPDTLDSMDNLAFALDDAGRHAEAA